jgi:hypothetical protein
MHYFQQRFQDFQYLISYSLSRAAAAVTLRVYDRMLQQVAVDTLPCQQGRNLFGGSFTCDPQITGPHYFVLSAMETEPDGASNRDRVPKPALQTGLVLPIYPQASHWRGPDYAYGQYVVDRLQRVIEGTRYQAGVHQSLPGNGTVIDSWEDDALFLLMQHSDGGGGGQIWISGGAMYAETTEAHNPATDIALDQLETGWYPHLYFVQLNGCYTACTHPSRGNLCEQLRRMGADITLGFTGQPWTGAASATWEYGFYGYGISGMQFSVYTAAWLARDEVIQDHGQAYGYDTSLIGPISRRDQSLWPSRYGG